MSKRGWYSSEVFFWIMILCGRLSGSADLSWSSFLPGAQCNAENVERKVVERRGESKRSAWLLDLALRNVDFNWVTYFFVIFHFFVFFFSIFCLDEQASRQASKQARDHQNTTITTTKTRNGKKIPKKIWTHFNSVNFVVDVCRNTVSLSLVFSRNMFRNWRLFGWQSHIPATSDCYACDAWP